MFGLESETQEAKSKSSSVELEEGAAWAALTDPLLCLAGLSIW